MLKKYTWYKIADSADQLELNNNGIAEMELAGKKICLVVNKEQVLACTAKCPHTGGRMSDGYIDALGNIVCPLHRYKFSLANGRNVSGEGYFLKIYPVEYRIDGIYVGFEENNFLGWLK